MGEPRQPKRVCRACGSDNDAGATRCASCGQDLNQQELTYVDPGRRVELTRFDTERGDEAELACGLLRANGIPCELSSTALPGLPADLVVWVNAQDRTLASALLEKAERDDEAA